MLNKIKSGFSSITFKLFIGFWLITLTSILLTKVISIQLTDHGVIVPAHPDDKHLLKFIQRRFERNPDISLSEMMKMRRHMGKAAFWIKQLDNNQVHSRFYEQYPQISQYISANNFTDMISVQFPYARITGPINIRLDNKPYQLFISSKTRHPPFGMFMFSLPKWARIGIPAFISLLMCYWLARSLIKPIKKLEQGANAIGAGKLDTRVIDVEKRNDELGTLGRSFNRMAEQLQRSITAQQRLLGDVSHELRSPLTRLQLALALAQKSQNETQQPYLQRCEQEISKLDTMIDDVLKLSRLENAQQSINMQTVDLTSMVKLLCDDAQFSAQQKQINIITEITPSIEIQGDQQLLASAIGNVINNAVKYAPNHSDISVSLTQQDKQITISVIDQGDGVPEQQLSHLFTPFFRVDNARDRQTGGTGLGLAIAKQAIQAHNGTITAENLKPQGFQVTIVI